jgi:hypothetical protein
MNDGVSSRGFVRTDAIGTPLTAFSELMKQRPTSKKGRQINEYKPILQSHLCSHNTIIRISNRLGRLPPREIRAMHIASHQHCRLRGGVCHVASVYLV